MQEDIVITFTVTVGVYGDYDTCVKSIDPVKGGVLWVGGAAFEIPAGALPDVAGGYKVSFTSQENKLVLKDAVVRTQPDIYLSI